MLISNAYEKFLCPQQLRHSMSRLPVADAGVAIKRYLIIKMRRADSLDRLDFVNCQRGVRVQEILKPKQDRVELLRLFSMNGMPGFGNTDWFAFPDVLEVEFLDVIQIDLPGPTTKT
ncbi:hypothetical protein [Rhizobium leguminosarum]|uniref:hypothetical protein n=1 Tax=Rhizobium leguminosarum TaxID=384 RepID=UPI0013B605C2|nr:hypothetical protein [Rhizobium leguminosarum]NEI65892.1 hypothetical protein [Rhizobium leguminosarum]